jgi:hypothetical protein
MYLHEYIGGKFRFQQKFRQDKRKYRTSCVKNVNIQDVVQTNSLKAFFFQNPSYLKRYKN